MLHKKLSLVPLCVDKYRNHGIRDTISYFYIAMVSLLYYT